MKLYIVNCKENYLKVLKVTDYKWIHTINTYVGFVFFANTRFERWLNLIDFIASYSSFFSSFHYFFVDNFSYVQLCGNFSNHSYPTLTVVMYCCTNTSWKYVRFRCIFFSLFCLGYFQKCTHRSTQMMKLWSLLSFQ